MSKNKEQAESKAQEEFIKDETLDNRGDNQGEATESVDQAKEIESLKSNLEEEKNRYLKLFAEFDNFRKRNAKERLTLIDTANKDVLSALLPILDDFERAIQELSKEEDNKERLEGVILIKDKLENILSAKGLKRMEVKSGDEFNSDIHEAITKIPAPSPELKGKIVDVVETGYKLGESVLRFPKVVIGE